MSKMRIAGAALNQTPLDWKNNLNNITAAVDSAIARGVDLLCLPELAVTGYGCEDLFLSGWLAEKAVSMLPAIAERCQGIAVAVGLPLRHGGTLYNCACLIKDGEILGFTAKHILANDGVHYEPRWFRPWPEGEKSEVEIAGRKYPIGSLVYDIDGAKVGVEICEDAWHPHRPANWLVPQGAEIILNLSASHFSFGKTKERHALALDPSEKYGITYVYANLLGNEAGRMIYDGDVIIAQNGKLLQRNTRLSMRPYNVVWADIDTAGNTVAPELNFDPEDKNTEFANASTLALLDYLRKSWSKRFVLSLSGGADSSACCVLVAHMVRRGVEELGVEEFLERTHRQDIAGDIEGLEGEALLSKIVEHFLVTVYQGTKNSGQATLDSAEGLADSVGAVFHHWTIDEEVESYTAKIEKAIGRKLDWSTDDLALQNIQARSRSPIVWMLTNLSHALLLTTSNRSEGDVGYATMDGDTSGSIAPIAAVDKHFILGWLRWAESELGYSGLRYVNSLKPSAELRPQEQEQTDEADLMPYNIIVEIEKLAIRRHMSPKEVFEVLSERDLEPAEALRAHVKKFYTLWARNQWKRERLAPSFHMDDFNVDPRTWCRFPILSGGFREELEEL
ncbi:NAD(+) synthase [Fulvitalea axinellae]|uniref:Glutamine-dependent NAD(+) synthetase n=1 Tax=Fulvitalea axinellae TaxID=1182444 RepID=A0AAU9CK10_9BACT|nr:NAD(+) synthase [Fulvitalea axinellae]